MSHKRYSKDISAGGAMQVVSGDENNGHLPNFKLPIFSNHLRPTMLSLLHALVNDSFGRQRKYGEHWWEVERLLKLSPKASQMRYVYVSGECRPKLNSPQDETRPVCRRCIRCGLKCEGMRDITFIEANIPKSRRADTRGAVSAKRGTRNTASADRQIPPSVSLNGFEFDIYICYSRKHLRRGASVDLELEEARLSDIITAGTTPANGQIFHQAVLSFAIIVFGTQHGQSRITRQGYAVHGEALKQLNQALSDPKCYTRDEVMISVATLAILECAVPSGQDHYLKHMLGLQKLMELRDPKLYCSPKSCSLYKSARHMVIFSSLRMAKPSILARAEWKEVIRSHCSDQEMREQDLFDVLADCTVLIAERDKMLASQEADTERETRLRAKIERRGLTLLAQLRVWKQQWDDDGNNSYVETSAPFPGPSPTHESPGDDSSPSFTVFEFSNGPAAIMLMFYNTTLIFVLRILASLQPETPEIESNQGPIRITPQDSEHQDGLRKHTRKEYVAAERSAALEICSCIPHNASPESRLEYDSSALFPWAVPTAWVTLGSDESVEGRRMMDILNTRRRVIVRGLWVA